MKLLTSFPAACNGLGQTCCSDLEPTPSRHFSNHPAVACRRPSDTWTHSAFQLGVKFCAGFTEKLRYGESSGDSHRRLRAVG